MKEIKLWAVMENTDSTEGRGYEKPAVYVETKELAEQLAHSPAFYKHHGVMGCNNCGVEEIEIIIQNELDLAPYLEAPNERTERLLRELRQSALAKLSKEEKAALGIKTGKLTR